MIFSKILSTGGYLPQTILTNQELEKRVDTSDAWITERTGIRARHIVSENETTTMMGVKACQEALERAGKSKDDVDMIVVATCTPEKIFPATACLIQQALGVKPCPAFDVQAACSGFMYALSVADLFIKSGKNKCALVVGAEAMSRVIDWNDRGTCVLFGDGAGALLLEASNEPGILSTHLFADGQYKDILYLDSADDAYLQMQGNAVFRLAVNKLDQVARATIENQGLTIADIDWLVPHQANIRIIQATAEKMHLPMEKVVLTLENHGNTSAASIPLAMHEYVKAGKIKRGQHLLLEAIGGGLTWGTALVRY